MSRGCVDQWRPRDPHRARVRGVGGLVGADPHRQRHKTFGMVFALSAYVVAGTAMLTPPLHIGRALAAGASLTDDPETFGFLLFLFYLGTVTLALTRHAVQTIRTRRDPDSIRTPGHVVIGVIPALGSLCVVIWAIAFWSDISIVMLALSPIGFFVAHDVLTYVYRRSPRGAGLVLRPHGGHAWRWDRLPYRVPGLRVSNRHQSRRLWPLQLGTLGAARNRRNCWWPFLGNKVPAQVRRPQRGWKRSGRTGVRSFWTASDG